MSIAINAAFDGGNIRLVAVDGDTVVIGGEDGVVFDWQPTLDAGAELLMGNRGTDPRLDAVVRPND